MKPSVPTELPRLRDQAPGEDLVRVSELVAAAAPVPELGSASRQRIRARLRRDLGQTETRRRRWAFRMSPVLVVFIALISASVVGAAVRSMLVERRLRNAERAQGRGSVVDVGPATSVKRGRGPVAIVPAGVDTVSPEPAAQEPAAPPEPTTPAIAPAAAVAERPRALAPAASPAVQAPPIERTAPTVVATRPSTPRPALSLPAPLSPVPSEAPRPLAGAPSPPSSSSTLGVNAPAGAPPAASAATATSPPPVAFAPSAVPATPPAARPVSRPPLLALARPQLAPPAAQAPASAPSGPPAASSPRPTEADLVADAIRALRRDDDANAALSLLEQHRRRFPAGVLAPEVTGVRIQALLRLGRTAAALAELERFPLEDVPGRDEWRVVRGELHATAGHWRQAEDDFSRALTALGGADHSELSERALWGRALARARQGDTAGAQADRTLVLRRFPAGRFAPKDTSTKTSSPGLPPAPSTAAPSTP